MRRRRSRTYGPPRARFPQARSPQGIAQGVDDVRRGTRRPRPPRLDPRSIEPLGLLHLGRLVVILLAADPGAALRAGLSRRARSGPSRRDEPLAAVLAGGRQGLQFG